MFRCAVRGTSMLPTYRDGDYVLATPFFRLKKGDVIVLKRSGKTLLKRIQEKRGDLLFVEGDNPSASRDSRHFGPIHISDVVGKVRFHAPRF